MSRENELLYFDTLKRIAKGYMTLDQLSAKAQKDYGVPFGEALEMAYENIQEDAAAAIHGTRRPSIAGRGRERGKKGT